MTIIDIINKKKNGLELTREEIEFSVSGYLNNSVLDYQMSALLMAIAINGMTDEETFILTRSMANSGDIIDLSNIDGVKIDKHSTGGVGDKTTLIFAPLVASCGVKVAKMSGRGLGHTGGTIDKLESIKGFSVTMSKDEFAKQVNQIGVAVVSQMGNLVPADKKMYALRDVTGTVESIPLIASSIMSKKIASNSDKIIIDVKVGNGALMKTIEDARKLAQLIVKIGSSFGKQTVCILTNMNEPLGFSVGNSLEVIESINILKGNKEPKDLYELVVELASIAVSAGRHIDIPDAKEMVVENLNNGKAYAKFLELINYQHGDISSILVAPKVFSVKSNKSGFINKIDALKIGNIVRTIGAGRLTKEDKINFGVGVVLSKKVGDFVLKDEELIKVYLDQIDMSINEILDCFEIGDQYNNNDKLIYEIIK